MSSTVTDHFHRSKLGAGGDRPLVKIAQQSDRQQMGALPQGTGQFRWGAPTVPDKSQPGRSQYDYPGRRGNRRGQ